MADLSMMTCEPCREWAPPLDRVTIEKLRQEISLDWEVIDDKKLKREVSVKNFMAGVHLIGKVADLAEAQGHHPNLCLHDYKQLTIELYTHKINGLHQNDFILAAKIDELL